MVLGVGMIVGGWRGQVQNVFKPLQKQQVAPGQRGEVTAVGVGHAMTPNTFGVLQAQTEKLNIIQNYEPSDS